jgi:hypothetical protein
LRHTWGWELLINTTFKTKLIEWDIPELGSIITSNGFQTIGMFIVQSQSQALKVFKHFILALQEENPIVTWIIVHNDKNIPLNAHRSNLRRTDGVHMKVTVWVAQSSQC